MDLAYLLEKTIANEASDLHLINGYQPYLRMNGNLHFIRETEKLNPSMIEKLINPLLSKEQSEYFHENKEIDIGYTFKNCRFRINVYTAQGAAAAAFRLIPNNIKPLSELGLPEIFESFTSYKQGLILFTGPTGEGKSTSLASLIQKINKNESKHIVTIEDPIEFVYPIGKSIISQREIHQDTLSWVKSLRSVLREDPDVVLVGEMRDYETIQSVLTVAETGHLVFSTLHTGSTPESIDRIIDVFPSHQQKQIQSTLANVLIAIVAQRLIPTANGNSQIPAVEILFNTPAVSSLIREGKTFMLDNILETNEDKGMIMFEKYLLQLQKRGIVSQDIASSYAIRKDKYINLINHNAVHL